MYNKSIVLMEIARRKMAASRYCAHAPHMYYLNPLEKSNGINGPYPDQVWEDLPGQNQASIERHKPNYPAGSYGEAFVGRAGRIRADHFEMVLEQKRVTVTHQGTGGWDKETVVSLDEDFSTAITAWTFLESGKDFQAPLESYDNPYMNAAWNPSI